MDLPDSPLADDSVKERASGAVPSQAFGRMPSYGELAPSFVAASDVNPKFNFLAMGGQWILLLFFGSLEEPSARAALDHVVARRALFDDDRAMFFGVSTDPADRGERGLKGALPGLRYFWDFDKAVSRLYGLVACADFRPMAFLLDPGRRVAGAAPVTEVEALLNRLQAELRTPEPEYGAPVLTVPLVLEPEFCRALIELYEAQGGGMESGFMREVDGMTVPMRDSGVKRRRDCNIPNDSPLHAGLRTRLAHRLIPQIEKAFCWRATRIERYIVSRYSAEDRGFFSRHRDNTTSGTAHRRFAVSINLNDDYDGGELCFPEFGRRRYKPPMGGATVFSCSLLHEATAVTRGVRFATLPFLYDDAGAEIREANRHKLQREAPAPPVGPSAPAPVDAAQRVKEGEALIKARQFEEGAAAFRTVAAAEPARFDAQYGLGYALFALDDFAGSVAAYQQAVALDPAHALAHNNLANALAKMGRSEEALSAYRRAIELQPANPGPRRNLANLLLERGELEAAVKAYAEAVKVGTPSVGLLNNFGGALQQLGRTDEALKQFGRALAAPDAANSPEDVASVHVNRAYIRLSRGHFEAGWADYEHRWGTPTRFVENPGLVNASVRARLNPQLSLTELAGSRVFVIGEQGIGDQIMFASMLSDLQAVAAEVMVYFDARLDRLIANSFPGIRVVGPEAGELPFDHLMVTGSLGRLFRNRLKDFPGKPYLSPSDGARRRWAERLGPSDGRKRIGISWRGGVAKTRTVARSMPLRMLDPILSNPSYEIFSLQYGDNSAEVEAANAALPQPIRMFDKAEIEDFDELAGLVANLDLVVSVQTALVHLCGALGAPALVMLPNLAEWRYGEKGPSMPWYRSVRLFRQSADGSWPPVVRRVAEEAAQRLNGS